jgi:hypothetical protein
MDKRPETFEQSELIRDALFAAIERRELQFLLQGEVREGYRTWLKKSKEYKKMVRSLGWF